MNDQRDKHLEVLRRLGTVLPEFGVPGWTEVVKALDYAIAALSAQPRPSVVANWTVLKIGSRGTAYDPPNTYRAFTYEHQPGNVLASTLGGATRAAAKASAGDDIDRGLGLLKELQAVGFGVFQVDPSDALSAQPRKSTWDSVPPSPRGQDAVTLDSLAEAMAAEFPIAAIVRALNKAAPGIAGAFAPPADCAQSQPASAPVGVAGDAVAALPGQWREARYYSGVDPEEVAREHADELEAAIAQQPAADTVTVQQAWELAGGNPGIKATREDLEQALRDLDAVCDEADQQPAPVSPVGVAYAWQEGYRQGVLDERTSEDNIGIAGFNAKIEPARVNPYLAQQPAAVDESAIRRGLDAYGQALGEGTAWDAVRTALYAALAQPQGKE